jgi:hypothetical protein
LIGKKNIRQPGETATFDVFISYRVASDSVPAQLLYDRLSSSNVRVWWDKVSLQPGMPWAIGFCEGLAKSRIFMPILSREAINSDSDSRRSFPSLQSDSPCDNVLLEHCLALELYERGMIEKIYPIMIGDLIAVEEEQDSVYNSFFSGSAPVFSDDVIVVANDEQLRHHLSKLGLGTPLIENLSVKRAYSMVLGNQGRLVQGRKEAAFDGIDEDVTAMLMHSV